MIQRKTLKGLLGGLCVGALWLSLPGAAAAQSPSGAGQSEVPTVAIPTSRTMTLGEVLKQVEKNNPDLKTARERLEQTKLLQDRALALIIPTAKVTSIYKVNDREITIPQGPGVEVVVQPKTEFRNIGVVQSTLDGRMFPLLKGATLAEEAAALGTDSLAHELGYGVSGAYYQLLTLKTLIGITETSIEIRDNFLKAAEDRLAAGVGTSFEVTRAKVEKIKAQKDLNSLRLSYLKAREAMAALAGIEADFEIADPPATSVPPELSTLLEAGVRENPSMRLARKNQEIADNTIDVYLWTYAPNLTAQFNAIQQPETLLGRSFTWNVQLIASWVLYDGGQREAQINEERSKLVLSGFELEKQEIQLKSSIKQAVHEVQNKELQIIASREEVRLAEEALRQAQDGYKLGATPQLDLINAEVQLRIARSQLASEELEIRVAILEIYKLAGQRPGS